jgi:hypothetical protein
MTEHSGKEVNPRRREGIGDILRQAGERQKSVIAYAVEYQ